MAKKDTEARKRLRSEQGEYGGRQGIGYYVPSTISREEWIKTKKLWEKKLHSSSFNDIEQFSHDLTGHFSPYFIKTGKSNSVSGSSASAARYFNEETLEYYRRVGLFYHQADFKRIFQWRGKVRLMRFLVGKRAEGATMQSLLNDLRDKAPKSIRQKRSIFWIHGRVHEINKIVNEWYLSNLEELEE